jgi:peptidoglycan/LPS O-acetylase OafA/YrhL
VSPSSALRTQNVRDYRIDVLRGISILLVLILHFHLAYNLANSPFATWVSAKFVEAVARNGNYGVTIFFVISGFLITSTSLRRFGALGNISARKFYAFRFARIFPCLLLILAIITSLGLAGVEYFKSNGAKDVSFLTADFSVLTFWHNVLMAQVGYFNYGLNILWSLSVEEVFYLVFPLLSLLLRRDAWILCVWAAAIIFGPIYRSHHADDEIKFLYGYFACFDAIAMGCGVALLSRKTQVGHAVGRLVGPEVVRRPVQRLVQLAACAFIAWIYLRRDIDGSAIFGPSLVAAGTALFLFVEGAAQSSSAEAHSQNLFQQLLRPLAWFGSHSYELYLFHIVVLAFMRNIYERHSLPASYKPLWLLFFLLLATLLAALIARFYSEPLNARIRGWLIPRPVQEGLASPRTK